MSTNRRVRRLTLRASDRGGVSAAAFRLEDAVRTASLPGLPAHGVVYLRRLELGPLSRNAPTGDLSRAIDDVVARVHVVPAGPGRSPDDRAAAVWFASELEPYRALAELIARGHRPRAWYWPVAVPGWSGSLPSAQGAVRILDGTSRISTGLTGLAYVAEPLLPRLLLQALEVAGPGATRRWAARCGVSEALVRARPMTYGEKSEEGVGGARRTRRVGGLVERAGHATFAQRPDRGTGRAGRAGDRISGAPSHSGLDRPEPRTRGPGAARSPSADWQAALESVVARWGAADHRASFVALLALSSERRGVTHVDAEELLRDAVVEARHDRAGTRRRDVERDDPGASHPGEASPSTADPTREEPGDESAPHVPTGREARAPEDPDEEARTSPREATSATERVPYTHHADGMAAEGAIVPAGPGGRSTEAAAPGPAPRPRADEGAERDRTAVRRTASEGGRSEHGGLAFLVVALQRLGFQDFLAAFPEYRESDLGLRVLERAAALLRTPPGDPALALLTIDRSTGPHAVAFAAPPAWRVIAGGRGSDGRAVRLLRVRGHPGTRLVTDVTGRLVLARWRGGDRARVGPWLENATVLGSRSRSRAWTYASVVDNWVMAIATYNRRFTGATLRHLVERPAFVSATRTHLDVVFAMSDLDSAIRAAGLDIDPAWVPWLGRVVRFHYVEGGGAS